MSKLIKCAGCGVDISKKAKACPHCGEPAPKQTSLLTWLVLILIILGMIISILSDNSISNSSTDTSSSDSSVSNQEVMKHHKRVQERYIQKEKDIKYFTQTKDSILEDINLKIKNRQYQDVINITTKYPTYKGKDTNISQIHTQMEVKLTKEILKKLKTIPSSEYAKNKQLYQILLGYEPNNKKYKSKVKFYSDKVKSYNDKIRQEEKKEADKIAYFGKPPVQSPWDGSYYVVENYLKRIAKDPDSVKIASCTKVMKDKDGWLVVCTWRARNGFGGMNAAKNRFTIRNDNVVRMY